VRSGLGLLTGNVLLVLLAVLHPGAHASQRLSDPDSHTKPSRPLSAMERHERLLEASQVVVLARVIAVDSIRPADSSEVQTRMRTNDRLRRVTLEPVEWLRGGLDGERIEIDSIVESGLYGPPRVAPFDWKSVAGVDTLAVLLSLRRLVSLGFQGLNPASWTPDAHPEVGMPAGVRIVPQRMLLAVRDSILRARDGLALDSLVARADWIVVLDEDAMRDYGSAGFHVRVKVRETLFGTEQDTVVMIRAYTNLSLYAGNVVFLRKTGLRDTGFPTFECLPFTASAAPDLTPWTGPVLTPEAKSAAVRAALERVGREVSR